MDKQLQETKWADSPLGTEVSRVPLFIRTPPRTTTRECRRIIAGTPKGRRTIRPEDRTSQTSSVQFANSAITDSEMKMIRLL